MIGSFNKKLVCLPHTNKLYNNMDDRSERNRVRRVWLDDILAQLKAGELAVDVEVVRAEMEAVVVSCMHSCDQARALMEHLPATTLYRDYLREFANVDDFDVQAIAALIARFIAQPGAPATKVADVLTRYLCAREVVCWTAVLETLCVGNPPSVVDVSAAILLWRSATCTTDTLFAEIADSNRCGWPPCPQSGCKHTCKRCMKATYCGRECQVSHWTLHKPDCAPSQPQ